MKTILAVLLLFASVQAQALISAFPGSINFFSVRLDGFGESQRVTVRNSGREDTRISTSNTCYGDFQVTNWCFGTLRAGGSCSIEVRFSPRREGYQSCSIWVRGSEGGSASIRVSGQGVR